MTRLGCRSTLKLVSRHKGERSLAKSNVGYSPYNTPHLAPALEFEDALLGLTSRLSSVGLPTNLKSESDLQALIPHIKSSIDDAKLWEYYIFDVQGSERAVADSLLNSKPEAPKPWEGSSLQGKSLNELAEIVKSSDIITSYRAYSSRYCTSVPPAVAAGFIQAAYPGDSAENQASRWGKILDVLNVDLYKECNEDIQAGIDGVVGRLRYTRLEEGGPKLGELTEE